MTVYLVQICIGTKGKKIDWLVALVHSVEGTKERERVMYPLMHLHIYEKERKNSLLTHFAGSYVNAFIHTSLSLSLFRCFQTIHQNS